MSRVKKIFRITKQNSASFASRDYAGGRLETAKIKFKLNHKTAKVNSDVEVCCLAEQQKKQSKETYLIYSGVAAALAKVSNFA